MKFILAVVQLISGLAIPASLATSKDDGLAMLQAKACVGTDCDVDKKSQISKHSTAQMQVEEAEKEMVDQAPPPGWSIVPDEFIDPWCDQSSAYSESNSSLGAAQNSEECFDLVKEAGAADHNINYGVWRGDLASQDCQACKLHSARFATDYVDVPGAVSFTKDHSCKVHCKNNGADWATKCAWESRACSACVECQPCTNLHCPRCEAYCGKSKASWDLKCGWESQDCRGCSSCAGMIMVGVFTIKSKPTNSYLISDSAGLSLSATTSGSARQWRMKLNVSTGLYSFKNVIDGKYLAASSSGSAVVNTDPDSYWASDLRGDRSDKTYALVWQLDAPPTDNSGYFLSAASSGALSADGSDVGAQENQWVFNEVRGSHIGTFAPTPTPTLAGATPTPTADPTMDPTSDPTPPPTAAPTAAPTPAPTGATKFYSCSYTGEGSTGRDAQQKFYPFTASDCGGELPVGQCFVALRRASQCGQDEDWMACGPGEDCIDVSDITRVGPAIAWWNHAACGVANVRVDYMCNPPGTQTTCTYAGNPTGSSKSHTFTAAECGGSLPTGECLVALRRGVQCGADEDWQAYGPQETQGASVVWWNANDCGDSNVAVDYLCNVNRGTQYTCSYTSGYGGSSGSLNHVFTAAECGGNLPTGVCLTGLRRASQCGGDEDWQAFGPLDSYGPSIYWWNSNPCANANAVVDYLCDAAYYPPSLTKCTYTGNGGSEQQKTYTFTDADCGGELPKGQCFVALRRASSCGPDEDWMACGPGESCKDVSDNTMYGAGVAWWNHAACGNADVQVDYMCNIPDGIRTTCTYSGNPDGNSKSHTFTASECGGSLPSGQCVVALRRATQCGGDGDWKAFGPEESQGAGVMWWNANSCGDSNIAVDYFCNVPQGTQYTCSYTGIGGSSNSREYQFTAADCGGTLPSGNCFAGLRRASQCGADEDYQAFGPADSYGPGVKWWNSNGCGNADIKVDYLCDAITAAPTLPPTPAPTVFYAQSLTKCAYSGLGGSSQQKTYSFTAEDCGGALPEGECFVALRRASQCGEDEDWMACAPGESCTDVSDNTMAGAGIAWWNHGSCGNSDVQVDYLCNVPSGTRTTCTYVGNPSGSSKSHTFTASECGGSLPSGQCVVALRRAQQCGGDEDWKAFGPEESQGAGVMWWNANDCGQSNIAVDYFCDVQTGTRYTCAYTGTGGSSSSRSYQFAAADCGGALPSGNCFVALRRASQCGPDEDWRAYGPSDSYGPGIKWWNSNACGNGDIMVDYLCDV